jgi:hypothetical protein
MTPWFKPGFVKEDLGFAEKIGAMVAGLKKIGRGEPE